MGGEAGEGWLSKFVIDDSPADPLTRQLTPLTRQLTPLEEGSYTECSTLLSTGHLAESCGTTGSTLFITADLLFGGKQTK
jgi:hypothetical protein